MMKKAVILLATGFEEIEAVTVVDILRRAGMDVISAGLDSNSITGSHEITVATERKISGLKPDFDAVIIPGGAAGALHLHNSSEVNGFIKAMASKGALVAGICAAPSVVMAPIGLLDNKNATCYPGCQIDFGKSTRYKNKAVVADGNIITSQGPGTAIEFAFAIVEKLIGRETVKKLKKDTLMD
ncbi:MAG: DJ-1 family protein [Candidatus Omnitrophica bacterium CG02_land_8_20_14_3_00__42_8]|nr:MAG: DJ-1 family protein [Candidatus Omnitrophica bacterium CG02_land_8_20_14_3_00__42_8]